MWRGPAWARLPSTIILLLVYHGRRVWRGEAPRRGLLLLVTGGEGPQGRDPAAAGDGVAQGGGPA